LSSVEIPQLSLQSHAHYTNLQAWSWSVY
jgi:hypothetical protein